MNEWRKCDSAFCSKFFADDDGIKIENRFTGEEFYFCSLGCVKEAVK